MRGPLSASAASASASALVLLAALSVASGWAVVPQHHHQRGVIRGHTNVVGMHAKGSQGESQAQGRIRRLLPSSISSLGGRFQRVALGLATTLAVGPSLLTAVPFCRGTNSEGGMGLVAPARAAKPYAKRNLDEKLGPIPAFLVVNGRGNPYLMNIVKGDEKLVGEDAYLGYRTPIHTNLEDAEEHMFELLQQPGYQGQVTVLVVSLGRAYDMIKAGWRATGFSDDRGREQHTSPVLHQAIGVWDDIEKLIPEKSLKNYESYKDAMADVDIPLFLAEGLVVEENGEKLRPLYLDPRDLIKAWREAAAVNSKMPRLPQQVILLNLPVVLQRMAEADAKDIYRDVVFVPSSRAMELVEELREEKGQRSRPLSRLYEY